MWATLISVIVGALLGAIPALLAPRLNHQLSQEAEKKRVRRERAEQLMAAVYENSHWLETVMNIRLFGQEGLEPPSPMAKANTIVLLYFPALKIEYLELNMLSIEYRKWILEKQKEKIGKGAGWSADGFNDIYQKYINHETKFLDSVAEQLAE